MKHWLKSTSQCGIFGEQQKENQILLKVIEILWSMVIRILVQIRELYLRKVSQPQINRQKDSHSDRNTMI
ncbi:hypothetical protein CVS40_4765 [Lucilia cuprina]|nr:hypothetical protein CVS40_4765 [Lucilia cuprina]